MTKLWLTCLTLLVVVTSLPAQESEDTFQKIRKDFQKAGREDDQIDNDEAKEFTGRLIALSDKKKSGRVGFDALLWVFYVSDVSLGKPDVIRKARTEALDRLLERFADTSRMSAIIDQMQTPRTRVRPDELPEFVEHIDRIEAKAGDKDVKTLCGFMRLHYRLIAHREKSLAADDKKKLVADFEAFSIKHGKSAHPLDRNGATYAAVIKPHLSGLSFTAVVGDGKPEVGKAAPEISGVDIDGVDFKLSDYRGKVVMLDFWGDW